MKRAYFWENNKVVSIPFTITSRIPKKYLGLWCFDQTRAFDGEDGRYGKYIMTTDGLLPIDWQEASIEELPKEFRTQLLLLGVS